MFRADRPSTRLKEPSSGALHAHPPTRLWIQPVATLLRCKITLKNRIIYHPTEAMPIIMVFLLPRPTVAVRVCVDHLVRRPDAGACAGGEGDVLWRMGKRGLFRIACLASFVPELMWVILVLAINFSSYLFLLWRRMHQPVSEAHIDWGERCWNSFLN